MPPLALVLLAALAHPALLTAGAEAAPRNAIDDLAEQLRHVILHGYPKKGIPVLDPLTVIKYDFVLDESPDVWAEGSAAEVRLEGLGSFIGKQSSKQTLLPPTITFLYTFRVPYVTAFGEYRMKGQIYGGESQDLFFDAQGNFTAVIEDFCVKLRVMISPPYKVRDVVVSLDYDNLHVHLDGAGEAGDVLSAHVAAHIEKWFDGNHSEIEDILAVSLRAFIEKKLESAPRIV